jgi:hypothetical protein
MARQTKKQRMRDIRLRVRHLAHCVSMLPAKDSDVPKIYIESLDEYIPERPTRWDVHMALRDIESQLQDWE